MNLLQDNIRKLFLNYLIPAIGSTLVVTAYCFIDTIAIGQGVGPNGTAACAIFLPVFAIAEFLGLLTGIGGCVLMSRARGEGKREKGNAYFTAAILCAMLLTAIVWVGLLLLQEPVYRLFGADALLLPYAMEYGSLIVWALPSFVFTAFFAAFIRNDGAPNLVMAASILGAVTNIIGDWLFVFPLDMGMRGAGLATVLGSLIQVVILGSYLFTKRCGLKFVRPFRMRTAMTKTMVNGFGTAFSQLAVIAVTFIANNQIVRYAGNAALAVYGMVCTISALFMHIFSGIGQAAQPIVSANFGAGQINRCSTVCRLGCIAATAFGIAFTALCLLFPSQITALFMKVTPEVKKIAPSIVRIYAVSFVPMGLNVFLGLYLQSIMRHKASTAISVLRGLVLNSILLYVLPIIWDEKGIWMAFWICEAVVSLSSIAITVKLGKSSD